MAGGGGGGGGAPPPPPPPPGPSSLGPIDRSGGVRSQVVLDQVV
ncbi:hypothetical protein ACEN85_00635 [Curtobacterium sp. CT11-45]